MRKTIVTLILLLVTGLYLVACSSDDSEKQTNSPGSMTQQEEETHTVDTNEGETDTVETNEEDKAFEEVEDSIDEYVEHQTGIQIRETGTEEVDGLSLEDINFPAEDGGRFLVANVTIKNTGR